MTKPIRKAEAASARQWTLARPNDRRSLTLAALGAVAGLLIAGFGLFTAQGTRTSTIPPEDVALINGVPILRADLITQLRLTDDVSLSQATATQRKAVLDAMIQEELAVQRGVELNMPTDDVDTRAALVAAMRGSLATDILASAPSDDELKRWFNAHRDHYAEQGIMELHALVMPGGSRERAVAAAQALRKHQPLKQAMQDFGLRSTGKVDDGEEFYFAAAIHLGPRQFAMAKRLRNGAVSDPVMTADGPVILVMLHNQPPVPQSFEQARDRVRVDYTRDRLARLEAANAKFLRDRADIKLAPDIG